MDVGGGGALYVFISIVLKIVGCVSKIWEIRKNGQLMFYYWYIKIYNFDIRTVQETEMLKGIF